MNPFNDRFDLTFARLFEVITVGIFIVPFRILLSGCLTFIQLPIYYALKFSVPKDQRKDWYYYSANWQKRALKILAACMRLQLHIMGIHYKVKGKVMPKNVCPIMVGGGHSSFLDSWINISYFCSQDQMVTMIEDKNASVLIHGFLGIVVRNQHVMRTESNSRHKAFEKARDLVKTDPDSRPILGIFAEGGTTNRSAMLKFKNGVFRFGCPVQPMFWKIENENQILDTFSCTVSYKQGLRNLILCWFHLSVNITIHLLPAYFPSEDEISDPQLYSENVQSLISKESGIPISPFSVENGLVYEICRLEGVSEEKSLAIAEIDILDIKNLTKKSLRPILNCIRKFIRSKSELKGPESDSDYQPLVSKNSDLLAQIKEYIFQNI